MVLYGYDASVFNACQNSKHWVAYFDTPVRKTLIFFMAIKLTSCQNAYTLGLVNSSYNIGAIVAGFFFGGPIVSPNPTSVLQIKTNQNGSLTSLDEDGEWESVPS